MGCCDSTLLDYKPIDYQWDALLQILINNTTIEDVEITDHTITFNGKYSVWCQNYPYAYGTRYDSIRVKDITGLPTIKTRKLLQKKYIEWFNAKYVNKFYKNKQKNYKTL